MLPGIPGRDLRRFRWHLLPGIELAVAGPDPTSPRWHHHGQAKEVFVIPLHADARQMLCADTAPHAMNGRTDARLSLHDHLAGMPDFRRARGQRYSLAFYFTIMIVPACAAIAAIPPANSPAGSTSSWPPSVPSAARQGGSTPRRWPPPSWQHIFSWAALMRCSGTLHAVMAVPPWHWMARPSGAPPGNFHHHCRRRGTGLVVGQVRVPKARTRSRPCVISRLGSASG